MDDDDFDFNLDSPPKKTLPKKGRRSDEPTLNELLQRSSISSPPQSTKTGGWADDNSSVSAPIRVTSENRTTGNTSSSRNEDDDDFDSAIIPDLDEVREESFTTQVATAPKATPRVATYQELDSELLKHAAFSSLVKNDGIDLSLLTKFLASPEELKEDDNEWTWDVLFTEVSSFLHQEEKDVRTELENHI